jgi:ribosome modulation factor
MPGGNDDVVAGLFGEGSDARVAGAPFDACPVSESGLKSAWNAGWIHVHNNWGVHAGRHVIRKLPEVEDPPRGIICKGRIVW